ncbi:hypothetical protein ABTN81_19690, partial [Acinetobacter baumannii]
IDLEVAADGRNNWSDLHQAPADKGQATAPAGTSPGEPGRAPAVVVGSIEVRNATLHYDDRKAGKRYAIEGLNLKTGTIDAGKPFEL